MREREFVYDIFVTYSHADGGVHWVKALIAQLGKYRSEISPISLRVFLDETSIRSMDDWEKRILVGLRSAKLMLAIASPNYFASNYCRKEWEYFVQHERDRGILREGIAPIYILTVSDLDHGSGNDWMRDFAFRQWTDFRDIWEKGVSALDGSESRSRLISLEQSVEDRLAKFEFASQSPTNIPPPPDVFVGRITELAEINRLLSQERVGSMVILHGIGGIGKSALAQQFALTYASQYPGGRFMVSAAGVRSLPQLLLRLLTPLEIEVTDVIKADPDAALQEVHRVLAMGPKRLLVIDNVDDAAVVAQAQVAALVPRTDQIEILMTTRLEPGDFAGPSVLTIDSLSTEEGVTLLSRYRHINPHESIEAHKIVTALGGHPLAVEVVAVFLWRNPDIDFAGFRQRLESEGISAVNDVAEDGRLSLSRHEEPSIRRLLEPTLAGLTERENRALEYGALFAPDSVPIPWVREMVVEDFPEIESDVRPGYPDPWKRIIRRLSGLRLLTKGRTADLARIHPIVRGVVLARVDSSVLSRRRDRFFEHVLRHATVLQNQWLSPDHRWRIESLVDLVRIALADREPERAIKLTLSVTAILWQLARYEEANVSLSRAIQVAGSDDEALTNLYAALARVQRSLRQPDAAMDSMEKAIAMAESNPGMSPEIRALCFNNVGRLLLDLGHIEPAERNLNRALEIHQTTAKVSVFGHATCLFNLAQIAMRNRETERARAMLEEALALREQHQIFESHADLVNWTETMRMLSQLERDDDNLGRAYELLQLALSRSLSAFEQPHPVVAWLYSEIGMVETLVGRKTDAAQSARRALEMAEEVLPYAERTIFLERAAFAEMDVRNFDAAILLQGRLLANYDRTAEPSRRLHQLLALMAQAEIGRGDLSSARSYLTRSIAMQEGLVNLEEEMSVGLLSEAYLLLSVIERRERSATGFELAMRKALEIAERGKIVTSEAPWPERYAEYVGVLQRLKLWEDSCRALRRLLTLMEAGGAPQYAVESMRERLADALRRAREQQ